MLITVLGSCEKSICPAAILLEKKTLLKGGLHPVLITALGS
jgi:hypothetical protein